MATATTASAPTAAEEKPKTNSALIREKAQEIGSDPATIQRHAAAQALRNAKWGKDQGLDAADIRAMESIAQTMNLSVALGHIIMLGGNMYITAAGHTQHAHATGQFDGFEEAALPKDEWELWGVPADAKFAWKCSVYRKGTDRPFTEVGWAGPSRDSNQPVAKVYPAELARKRGRARALAIAFPVGLVSVEEIQRGVEIPDDLYNRAVEGIQQPRRASESASVEATELAPETVEAEQAAQ